MAHYARINAYNIVEQVIVADQEFINSLEDATSWIQTSYNTLGGKHYNPETNLEDNGVPLRKNYAGLGFTYDATRDAFIPPQPFLSWELNETTCLWEPPQPYPEDGHYYTWNEDALKWELINIQD